MPHLPVSSSLADVVSFWPAVFHPGVRQLLAVEQGHRCAVHFDEPGRLHRKASKVFAFGKVGVAEKGLEDNAEYLGED